MESTADVKDDAHILREKLTTDINATKDESSKPLVPPNFVSSFKSQISEMTREELEEFCLLKIIEGIADRINLSDIKSKLKTMTRHVDEWRKKAMMLTKQTRDLQVVLEKVQEDYRKHNASHVMPMRITRSVGMQVLMSVTRPGQRHKKPQTPNKNNKMPPNIMKGATKASPQQAALNNNSSVAYSSIPVPKLVPVTAPPKTVRPPPQQTQNATNSGKPVTPNGVKSAPANKAEKRPFGNVQSVTVDLTDDEPPAKQTAPNRNPGLRVVSPQQLMQTRPQFSPETGNSPRKVYIPISGTQSQSIRPGQTIMFKAVPPIGKCLYFLV